MISRLWSQFPQTIRNEHRQNVFKQFEAEKIKLIFKELAKLNLKEYVKKHQEIIVLLIFS